MLTSLITYGTKTSIDRILNLYQINFYSVSFLIWQSESCGPVMHKVHMPLMKFEILCFCPWWKKLSYYLFSLIRSSALFSCVLCPRGRNYFMECRFFVRPTGAILSLMKYLNPPPKGEICPWWNNPAHASAVIILGQMFHLLFILLCY